MRESKVLPIEHLEISMELPIDTGFYALAGATIGAVPAALSAWYTAKSNERSSFRKAIIEASKEIWLERFKAHQSILPYEHFLAYSTLMAEFFFDNPRRLDDDAVRARKIAISKVIDVLAEQRDVKKPV